MAGVTSKEDKTNSHIEAAIERVRTVTHGDSERVEIAKVVRSEQVPLEPNASAGRHKESRDELVSRAEKAAQITSGEHQDSQPDQSAGNDCVTKPESTSDEVYTEIRHDLDQDPGLKLDGVNDHSPRIPSIAIRKGTAGPVYPGLRATNWENRTGPKPAASRAVMSILVLLVFCLGVLGFFEYRLKLQMDDLRRAVSAFTETKDNIGDSIQGGALEKNLAFGQMTNRVSGLTARVDDLNATLVGLGERIREGFEIRSSELSEDKFQAVADQMNSLRKEINQLKSEIARREVQTAAPVKPRSKQPEHPNVKVPETQKAQTSDRDRPQTTVSGVNDKEEWILNLASAKRKEGMETLRAEFQAKGIETQLTKVMVGQTEWYRLRVLGFASKQEATQVGERAKKTLGLERYWIGR